MYIPKTALDSLLDNLGGILKFNYHLVADERDDIQALHNELATLKGPLNIASAKYSEHNKILDDLVGQIRSVVDRAEDAVDRYLFEAAMRNSRGWISKVFHQIADHHKVLRDLRKVISDEVRMINEKKQSYSEVWESEASIDLNQPQKSIVVRKVEVVGHVVGFDDEAKNVSELLVEGPAEFEVISIVGILGIGKTTLAKMVFEDPDVDYEFMIKVFVHVSEGYEKRKVLLNILNSFTQNQGEVYRRSEEELARYVRECLNGKNYLIVLDDVRDTKDWDSLKAIFPENKKRCRVLITTRNENVGQHANSRINPYRLKTLPPDTSRVLLCWKVFGENHCPEDLLRYGIKIVEKCEGLPLAIVVIAGILLSHSHDARWWKNVADNVKAYIIRDEETTDVLKLMYKYLPNYLKPCFLYLGVFGEDTSIPVWKLVRLWIAEGFIREEKSLDLEDMAEQYLEELVYRNLVMVGQRSSNGKIKTCLLQSTLLEFCKSEAMTENLFQEIKKDKLSFFLSENPTLDQYRRLCINSFNILNYISGRPSGQRVRSFLTSAKEEIIVEPRFVACIPKAFNLLRVLEVQSLIFTRFPAAFSNLILLKYIAISSKLWAIPSAVYALRNMQTLIVETTSNILEIEADIWKMLQFRHLHTNASAILPSLTAKNRDEDLTGKNIRTLSTISPESCQAEVFRRTNKLRKLGIRGRLSELFEFKGGESCLFDNIGKLYSLENLKLLGEDANNRLHRLPPVRSFPPQLKKLTLSNTLLDWQEMTTLGNLENLEILKLKVYAFQGKLWHTEKGGFRCLKYLYVGRSDLVIWEASADHFPELERLQLNGCDDLQAVPLGLADISSLQLLILHCTNPGVASSARKLQVLKLKQARKGNRSEVFKLSIYPPEH